MSVSKKEKKINVDKNKLIIWDKKQIIQQLQ